MSYGQYLQYAQELKAHVVEIERLMKIEIAWQKAHEAVLRRNRFLESEIERLRAENAKLAEDNISLEARLRCTEGWGKSLNAALTVNERLRDLLDKWQTIVAKKHDEVEWLRVVLRDCIALLDGNVTTEAQRGGILRVARAASEEKP